jgi:hypothetical protein
MMMMIQGNNGIDFGTRALARNVTMTKYNNLSVHKVSSLSSLSIQITRVSLNIFPPFILHPRTDRSRHIHMYMVLPMYHF